MIVIKVTTSQHEKGSGGGGNFAGPRWKAEDAVELVLWYSYLVRLSPSRMMSYEEEGLMPVSRERLEGWAPTAARSSEVDKIE